MKITVDFVRAEQHWDPDSGAQQNFLVFYFAGKEHRIECDEEDVVGAIRSSRTAAPVASGLDAHANALGRVTEDEWGAGVEDEQGDFAAEELEREFGGDASVVNNPPMTFAAAEPLMPRPTENAEALRRGMIEEGMASRARSGSSIKADKLARLRQVAQRAPHNRVEKDEMGYPIVAGPAVAKKSAGQATIVRKEIASGGDDDPFGQG
jgi:hypothetical protein